jgi:hypothetical protein
VLPLPVMLRAAPPGLRSSTKPPGCVVPSMTTGWVIAGSDAVMSGTPPPGTSNSMSSRSEATFAFAIACASEPAPLASVLITLKVAARESVPPVTSTNAAKSRAPSPATVPW